jgi:hypothetical protein
MGISVNNLSIKALRGTYGSGKVSLFCREGSMKKFLIPIIFIDLFTVNFYLNFSERKNNRVFLKSQFNIKMGKKVFVT